MSDVFISYSRLDRDFVGKLREALLALNQDVWIDWEAIPPSQSWWEEIKKGIAKTNNFVVILSPNSMASPICHMEIEYARKVKKRIIPVLLEEYVREISLISIVKRLATNEEVTTREIWGNRQVHDLYDTNEGELKHINYFLFTEKEDFDEKFKQLFVIIRTDYLHKEQHTLLELRSLEWNKNNRNASFLLLDDELEQAKNWLIQSVDKQPLPTNLQYEYINASEKRTQQLKRIRYTSILGTIFALVGFIFAAGSILVSNRVVSNANFELTDIAIEVSKREAVAESMRLANWATSLLEQGNFNEIAVLIGIRALTTADTPQANSVLALAIDQLHTDSVDQIGFSQKPMTLGTLYISAVDISPDSSLIVGSDCCVGNLKVWSLNDRQLYQEISMGSMRFINDVIFHPDGKHLIVAFGDILRLVEIETGTNSLNFQGHEDNVIDIDISDDGNIIISGSDDGSARIWNADTGNIIQILEGKHDKVSAVAISPNGMRAISIADGQLFVWDVSSGDRLQFQRAASTSTSITVSGSAIAFSSDGQSFMSMDGETNQEFHVRNTRSGEILLTVGNFPQRIVSLSFSMNDEVGVVGFSDRSVKLVNLKTGQIIRTIPSPENPLDFAGTGGVGISISPDNSLISIVTLNSDIRIWHMSHVDFISYACTLVHGDLNYFDEGLSRQLLGLDNSPTCQEFEN